MNVRAMVMAAGAGTRLRPLTYAIPKPMVPIANRPVLEYTVENLKRHGITEIIFNLHNHPGLIRDHFKDGSAWGVKIRYSYEPKLLGTAGGRPQGGILSGECHISGHVGRRADRYRSHGAARVPRQKKSAATIGLKAVDKRFEYGVTLTDARGRIQRFIEKPQWGDVFSNQVNTGIYVFEPRILKQIPPRQVVDFGHEIWPKLLSQGEAIYGYLTDRYWCDVGNLSEYRRAQRDFLDGKVGFRAARRPDPPRHLGGRRRTNRHRSEAGGALPDRTATAVSPKGSVIGAYTVIGQRRAHRPRQPPAQLHPVG